MTSKTLISATEKGLRVAVLEDGEVAELHLLPATGDITGPLYRARVRKIDDKLNAAFLDLGGREAFLPLRHAKALKDQPSKAISSVLHEGQTVLVKIVTEAPEGGKLPVATANPMIAGRYALSGHLKGPAVLARSLVGGEREGALSRLLSEEENGRALIIRSNAKGVPGDVIRGEIDKQRDLWALLEANGGEPGEAVPALSAIEKALRDFAPGDAAEILIDDRTTFLKAEKLAAEKWPDLVGKIKLFDEKTPIMEAFGVEDRLAESLEGIIALPSGGNITIEETAAMTVIDVNSGAGRKGTAPGALHLATNLEAAKAVAREIRFQNIGGLITVDFIDMKKIEDREKVSKVLGAELAKDHLGCEASPINRFGLLTIKRRRRGLPLKKALEEFGK